MTVSVIVPFTPGECADRDRAWDWVRARYLELHPTWELVQAGDAGLGEWCKAEAVAAAVECAAGDVLVVADADSFLAVEVLETAAGLVASDPNVWVCGHARVRRLTEWTTGRLLEHPVSIDPKWTSRKFLTRSMYPGPPGGGITVVSRSAWDRVPMDPRFVGWGGEDLAWGRALSTLVGPWRRLAGDLWPLWHPPAGRCQSPAPASVALAERYRRAVGDQVAMTELIEEVLLCRS